jgi:ribosomal-protein-alanine N-acetyltransferase
VLRLLEGKNVNLRVMEKEDVSLFAEWFNNPHFLGEFWDFSPAQRSKAEIEKTLENNPFEYGHFIVEKKDGTRIGLINHFNMLHPLGRLLEIGYVLIPEERSKGYCTEAVQLILDYLFLSKNVERIQASTHLENKASQRVLENTGFKREGIMRKALFSRGHWQDGALFSILREEWKRPKIITRMA